jgi:tetratricopeptide (TPR) repeat protein
VAPDWRYQHTFWLRISIEIAKPGSVARDAAFRYNFGDGIVLVARLSKPGLPFSLVLIAVLTLCGAAPARAQDQPAGSSPIDEDYRAGLAAVARNDFQAALKDFQHVVRAAPSVASAHSALGFVLMRLGRTTEAIPELEKALALDPADSSTQLNLAIAYEQSGSPAKANAYFARLDAAARAQGHSLTPPVLAEYARSLAETRQWDAADAKMKQAVAADPKSAELHDQFGNLYVARRNWRSAQEQFVEAIRLQPNFADAHLHLGLALQALGDANALDELAKAYELAPQSTAIAAEYGKALALSGNDDRAIAILEHALELSPKSTSVSYQLGLAYQRSGRFQDAVSLLEKVAAAEPRNAGALTNLGVALCQTNKAKDALPYLRKAVSLAPGNVTARQNLVAAYVQLGQYDDAIAESRAALKLDSQDARLHYNLGVALKMQDDASDAIPELQAAEKFDPSMPEAPYALGTIYMQAGRFDEAAQELTKSLKLRPQNGEAWATLGSVYNSLGKLPDAASALREAISRLPDQSDPHLTLAAVLEKEDDSAGARAERKIAAELMSVHMNQQRAEVATHAGLSILKSGNVPGAIAEFKDAISYDPSYIDAHLGLASAYERQGMKSDAEAERQRASDLKKSQPAE